MDGRFGWLLAGAALVGAGWHLGGAFGAETGIAAGMTLVASLRVLARRRLARRPEITEGESAYEIGYRLLRDGLSDRAIPYLEEAAHADASDLDARFYLGVALAHAGRHGDAEPLLAEVAERRPLDADARYRLGITLAALGRHTEAAAQFDEALRLRPQLADVAVARAAVSDTTRAAAAAAARRHRFAPAREADAA